MDAPVYFHRIGRTARKGEDGTAIRLVSYGEMSDFNNIKALTKTKIQEIKCARLDDDSPIKVSTKTQTLTFRLLFYFSIFFVPFIYVENLGNILKVN